MNLLSVLLDKKTKREKAREKENRDKEREQERKETELKIRGDNSKGGTSGESSNGAK